MDLVHPYESGSIRYKCIAPAFGHTLAYLRKTQGECHVSTEICLAEHVQALWYFLSSAVVLGVVGGLIIHLSLSLLVSVLKLDRSTQLQDVPATGHDAASYRTARKEKKHREEVEERQRLEDKARLLASQPFIQEVVREARRQPISGPMTVPISPNTATAATRSGLFTQTILEYSDEDSDSAF